MQGTYDSEVPVRRILRNCIFAVTAMAAMMLAPQPARTTILFTRGAFESNRRLAEADANGAVFSTNAPVAGDAGLGEIFGTFNSIALQAANQTFQGSLDLGGSSNIATPAGWGN